MKELKELIRDPKILLGMIVVPLIMFPVLGGVMSYSVQSAQERAQRATLLVVNNDEGNWSDFLINFLNVSARISVESNIVLDNDTAMELLAEYNSTQLLEIPMGFGENMIEHVNVNPNVTAAVKFYGVFVGVSIFENMGSPIDRFVYDFNRLLAPDVLKAEKSTIIKGEIISGVDPATLSSILFSQTIALPITIMILLTYSIQIAATSVAMEKEEKTLETLLTLPMDRLSILAGKLSGSIFVAGVGALAYMIGYNYMLGAVTSAIPAEAGIDLAALGLVPSLLGYLLLGISLFVALLSALALAVILSAFAEDVRGAQSLVGFIYPLIFLPSFALMYVDIGTLPFAFKIVLYAIPFSHPTIASRAVIMGDYLTAAFGIVYVSAFTIGVMYAASRFFATEKILTAKLKFKGLRRRRKTPVEEF
ncbi:MAG: ABC transporter permease [Candidatus Bathyarchaeota archaeon]|nr:ABC transporter permease [Candidatus Bathyarchaeota archaeon]MDH5788676.1 ABC transporter permease [Candidatus Bathyarchaeota archaeon]